MKTTNRRTQLVLCGIAVLLGILTPGCITKPKTPPPYQALGACAKLNDAFAIDVAGGDYVEEAVKWFLVPEKPTSEWKKNLAKMKESPLPVLVCDDFLPDQLRCIGEHADQNAILKYAETAFRRGQEAGVKIIVFNSSGSRNLDEGFPKEKADEQFISLLKQMGPLAQQHGITVAVEPLRREECNFINTVLEGADIVERVRHPNIRLASNWCHMMQNGEDPKDLLKVGHLIVHTHIAEKEKCSVPGVMGDDFRPFFSAFKTIGYKGRISIEGKWKIEELPKAFDEIKKQAREAQAL